MLELFVAKALFFAIGFFILGSFVKWTVATFATTDDIFAVAEGKGPVWIRFMGFFLGWSWFLATIASLVFLWSVF